MPIINQEQWDKVVEVNAKDDYSKCCVDVAREAMRLLDTPEYQEFDCHKIIIEAEHNIGEDGITGYMAGVIASMISQHHSRGGEFRLQWNAGYGVSEEKTKGGIVNPAILTFKD